MASGRAHAAIPSALTAPGQARAAISSALAAPGHARTGIHFEHSGRISAGLSGQLQDGMVAEKQMVSHLRSLAPLARKGRQSIIHFSYYRWPTTYHILPIMCLLNNRFLMISGYGSRLGDWGPGGRAKSFFLAMRPEQPALSHEAFYGIVP